MSEEKWIEHEQTMKITRRTELFRREVRNRDGKCVISGIVIPESHIQTDNWRGFEACHIFPLQYGNIWDERGYDKWITDIDENSSRAKINSSQNGLLLQATVHKKFDDYVITVNPNDKYKIVVFDIDIFGWDGRILDPVCRDLEDPHHVPDELLEWHYVQSVLANVRGP